MTFSPRLRAILQAILTTFLWSTSWVLIKFGLRGELPPITFAGLRYELAFLCLAPFVLFNPQCRSILKRLPVADWRRLALAGVIVYTLTQGAQFVSLAYLPTATLNLVLNLTAAFVAGAGIFVLNERPTFFQWAGILLTVVGVLTYFLPASMPGREVIGLLAALACLAGNVAASLIGRHINRGNSIPPLLVTFVSMGIGAAVLLAVGLTMQGFGRPTGADWLIVAWLAIVNTAFAFTLWNNTLRTLSAVESAVLNSLMMPQIAILALFFLGEAPKTKEFVGLAFVFIGVIIVQIRKPAAVRLTRRL